MKMNKVLAITLTAACAAMLLTACGGSKSSGIADEKGSKDNTIESVDDLNGKKIGVQTGTTGDLYISDDESLQDATVERYNKGFEAVQALSQGKIDAVVIDDQPAQQFIKDTEGLKILDTAYSEEEYAICLKKDSDLTKGMNEAIEELKSDGTFDQIVAYYIDGEGDYGYQAPADVDHSKGTLVMGTNAEFPPYEYYGDDEDKVVGIDADFAQAICDKMGYELKIEDMAFDSIIPAVQSGKADFGAAGMTVTDERKTQVDFTDSYYMGKQVIIVAE